MMLSYPKPGSFISPHKHSSYIDVISSDQDVIDVAMNTNGVIQEMVVLQLAQRYETMVYTSIIGDASNQNENTSAFLSKLIKRIVLHVLYVPRT